MKFENTQVFNFEGALRGMRNPKNSWANSDSYYDDKGNYIIGPKDMKLAQTLIRSGTEHRKFLRQIFVCVDITAPLYWWKEMDTYKVATVANSTSTMHKLASKPITIDDFETDDYFDYPVDKVDQSEVAKKYQDQYTAHWHVETFVEELIEKLEEMRLMYVKTQDKAIWKELIRWLPESYLQKRTVTLNYETLLAQCSKSQRRFHKLNEWSGQDDSSKPNYIAWARSLPYAQQFIFIDEEDSREDVLTPVI